MRWTLTLILLMAIVSPGAALADGSPRAPATGSDELVAKVARIRVGSSTQSEVAQLLGRPWRTIDTNDDPDDDDYRIWEYLGQDGADRYRIHIGFDEANVVRLIAKSQKGRVEVLARSNGDRDQHEHDSSAHGYDK